MPPAREDRCYPNTVVINLAEHSFGLRSEAELRINRMLRDYDPNLSLRRIPEGDPAFNAGRAKTPPHTHGVWEEGVNTLKGILGNWVFTLAEMSIDHRVLARIAEGDMRKHGVPEKIAKLRAHQETAELERQRAMYDIIEERREEMEAIGRMARTKSTIRHRINGEDVIIGDTVRPLRAHV